MQKESLKDLLKKKKNIVYLLIYALILIFNIGIVIVFRERAKITPKSTVAILTVAAMIIHALICFYLRHCKNFLDSPEIIRPFKYYDIQDYTYEEEYLNRFFLMMKIQCAAIPFNIPPIFFTKTLPQLLWPLGVALSVQIIYLILDFVKPDKREKNEYKIRKKQIEDEKKEQEKREELGRFK